MSNNPGTNPATTPRAGHASADRRSVRTTGTVVLTSPLRFALSGLALTAGFAYVLETEDQFKRAAWFGLLFAALTAAWFVVGSFLAAVDTVTAYRAAVGVGLASFGLWAIGQGVTSPEWIDDVGDLEEPLTRLRLLLAGVVTLVTAGVLVTAGRVAPATGGTRHRSARIAGVVTLTLGLVAVVLTARAQAYFDPEGPVKRSLAELLTR